MGHIFLLDNFLCFVLSNLLEFFLCCTDELVDDDELDDLDELEDEELEDDEWNGLKLFSQYFSESDSSSFSLLFSATDSAVE